MTDGSPSGIGPSAEKPGQPTEITPRFIEAVCARLHKNERVRRSLPVWGRVHIDRQLPFLCVYRHPQRDLDPGTERLVTTQAAYVTASASRTLETGLSRLVREIAQTLVRPFGAFLVLEVWAAEQEATEAVVSDADLTPGFRLIVPDERDLGHLVDGFEDLLGHVRVAGQAARVEVARSVRWCPRRFSPLLSPSMARQIGCSVVGLEVKPVYRDPSSGALFPLVLRQVRRGLARALAEAFYDFARTRTARVPRNHHVLGRRAVVKAVWDVDERLAEVSERFDFILQVTPVNAAQAWLEFKRNRLDQAPLFHYRPLPADPVLLKRRLYEAPVERVDDPALALLFRQKQEELDRQITLLADINTHRFVHGSIQLFGPVSRELIRVAEDLLERLPPRARDDSKREFLDSAAFARRARAEIAHYRKSWSELDARVDVRDDIGSSLMVSQGSLLVGKQTRIPAARADALLQHEVGTHIVTYYNGRAQPFRLLYAGLAGYETLQEGLAVLAEYLVGGLSRPRLRLLAGRVIAARGLVAGATFVETFRELDRKHGFDKVTAFTVAMRIHRGGGLTKDAVYLQGISQLLTYLADGGDIEPLFMGKIAADHIPVVQELQWRGVLRNPPLLPRYLNKPEAISRMNRLRKGLSVLDLVREK